MKLHEDGFTLPELIVAILVVVVLLAGSLLLLRPANLTTQEENAQRRTQVARLVQALNHYVDATGGLPPNIPTKETVIGSESGQYNLCTYLVPTYLNTIPFDPVYGLESENNQITMTATCNEKGVLYTSGYSIMKLADGRVAVYAPAAVNETISIESQ